MSKSERGYRGSLIPTVREDKETLAIILFLALAGLASLAVIMWFITHR